jgi:miniconductance mechanosensitive channel
MIEGGARRIKRSIHIDQHSVQFCTPEMIDSLLRFDLVREYLETELSELQWEGKDAPGRDRPTNMDIYRQYAIGYLRSCPDLHQRDQTLLVRQLAPGSSGLPLEIYAFANTTDWTTYEEIQAAILNHLLAALPHFGLRLFQQPSGADLHAVKLQGN